MDCIKRDPAQCLFLLVIFLRCGWAEGASLQGARTYICGLVSSMVPYIINHAGQEVEARRDVMWEQEDADSLRKKYADKWKSQREEDVVWKQINVSLLCYLFLLLLTGLQLPVRPPSSIHWHWPFQAARLAQSTQCSSSAHDSAVLMTPVLLCWLPELPLQAQKRHRPR